MDKQASSKKKHQKENGPKKDIKHIMCWASPGCHDRCGLLATVEDGKWISAKGNPNYPKKGQGCKDRLPHFEKWLYHEAQLRYPLKRKGERGENKWERISWDQALDEIASKLAAIKDQFGAQSLSVHEGTYRNDMYGIRARFLNLFGNPANVAGAGTICKCNRVALWLALVGSGIVAPKANQANCIVLSGSNVTQSGPHRWIPVKKRLKQGAKLIVVDPRKIEACSQAHMWIQLRPGTDTALYMAWLNVIIEESLFDEAFVRDWTFGFEDLKQRVSEYTPEKVEQITWVPAKKIRDSARMYATNGPAVFNMGVATDTLGLNSIRAEQARMCLRAVTGNLSLKGGETILGPGPLKAGKLAIRDSMLQLADKVSPEQRRKQLGYDRFKLMGWPAYEIISPYFEKTYQTPFPMSGHNFLVPQPLVWEAILTEKPYPMKAMITWTTNMLLNSGGAKTIYKALKSPNLELHVVMEHVMTPTALLADYVLPIASKLEKPVCHTHEDFDANIGCCEQAIEPIGERKPDYYVWRQLAHRLGFGEYFPWETEEELADYRLSPLGLTFKEVAKGSYTVVSDKPWTYATLHPETGKPTGFATPSGKVELYSNVLEQLGYDPLPFYEEPPESPVRTPDMAKEYPFILITGANFRPMFHSENRHIGMGTREQYPEPLMEIHPDAAGPLGIADGDWVYVETQRGAIRQKAKLTQGIDARVINVQSHWWFPEEPGCEPWLHGLWPSNANVLTRIDLDTCDPVTGGWPMRALMCKVYKAQTI